MIAPKEAEKHMCQARFTHEQVARIRAAHPAGARVRLVHMHGEPQMPVGLEGTVETVDDAGQIHVRWDNGSGLALNVNVDRFDLIKD